MWRALLRLRDSGWFEACDPPACLRLLERYLEGALMPLHNQAVWLTEDNGVRGANQLEAKCQCLVKHLRVHRQSFCLWHLVQLQALDKLDQGRIGRGNSYAPHPCVTALVTADRGV